MTARSRTRPRTLAIAALLTAALIASGCASDDDTPKTAATASSSNSSSLPTPPGVVKDSIEDINSTKDMTGVITTYSGDDNPYIKLIPYVCPFLPDTLTRDQFGMTNKSTGFDGQHTLLQTCNMGGPTGVGGKRLGVVVSLRATSFADTTASKTHTDLARGIPIWRNVTGTLYKNAGDDVPTAQFCNLAWGTFYGTAVVTVSTRSGYPAEPCQKAREWAPLIAPYLPSKPIQMRPTEG